MRKPAEILRDIARFTPVNGIWLPLDHLLEELWRTGCPGPECLSVLFGVFERFPRDDGAGVLWTVVHCIEGLPYDYQQELRESYARVPSDMGQIMMTRLANSTRS